MRIQSSAEARNDSFGGKSAPPNAIFTTYELFQLYEHLIDDPDVCVIQLTQSLFTVVDAIFYPIVSKRSWYPQYSQHTGLCYAIAFDKETGKTIYLHQEIMRLAGVDFKMVDHDNGDSLDNRLSNLRTTTAARNQQKADRKMRKNATGFEGVARRGKRFEGYFRHIGKQYSAGFHDSALEAFKAREEAKARIRTEHRELSVEEKARLAILRSVIKQMRDGLLTVREYILPQPRRFVVGKTAA